MKMSGAMVRAGLCAGLLLFATPAFAQSPTRPASSPPAQPAPRPASPPLKWGPFIDLGGAVGTDRNIGESDLFVPLWQDSRSMLFTDIRGRFDDQGSLEGNFGLGVRHMLASGWNLGGYVYYDRLKSALGNSFGQATVGAEALSLNWDVRANLYRPIGPSIKNLYNTSTSTAALSGTSVLVTTTSSEAQEVEQPGFDAEIGWRVPIFAPDSTTQLRVYAGGYRFAAPGVPMTAGPRGRLDLTIGQVPHLWHGARLDLGAELQHDGPRGTQAFALISLRVPLEIFKSAPPATLTPMERRMEDPIVRDVDVVTETRTVPTSTLTETATETTGGQSFTVINSASTTGANLPTAVTNAGANSTVLLSGTFDTTATTTLQSGQTLTSTLDVKTPSGHTATVTTSADIADDVVGPTISMGSNSILQGLTVSDTVSATRTAYAVAADSVSGAQIIDNTLNADSGSNNAVGFDANNATNLTLSGNTITANTTGGARAINISGSSATVTDNSLSASGGTTSFTAFLGNTTIQSGSTGNTDKAGVCHDNTGNTGQIEFTDGSHCP